MMRDRSNQFRRDHELVELDEWAKRKLLENPLDDDRLMIRIVRDIIDELQKRRGNEPGR